jgi:hypothetical protein
MNARMSRLLRIAFFLILIISMVNVFIHMFFTNISSEKNALLMSKIPTLKPASEVSLNWKITIERRSTGSPTRLHEMQGNDVIRTIFELIYKNRVWESEGEGSGRGSTIQFTKETRKILHDVIKKYKIKSMLDAPCGSFNWMPLVLEQLNADLNDTRERFIYHGIDIVHVVINHARIKYQNKSNKWRFSQIDFTQQQLPSGYELIFSRDALQHLDYISIIKSLQAFSSVHGARYLLVGSYILNGHNRNIAVGDYFPLDLTQPPFNLNQTVEIFPENNFEDDEKYLILYDIPNYLRFVDFNEMRTSLTRDLYKI